MRLKDLVKHSLTHYWRSNVAVVCGVATAVAVLAGALLVGHSVRSSLRQLVVGRLGQTDEVIAYPGFFRSQLVDDLRTDSSFSTAYRGAVSLIMLEAVVTSDDNKRRSGNVNVYAIDEQFFKFHDHPEVLPASGNEVLISPGLASELGARQGETLLLRIEKPSAIPIESLHSRKEDLGITLRSTIRDVLASESPGEFSLRPQQSAVRAIFLPLVRLQKNLGQDGKVNAILLARSNPSETASIAKARDALKAVSTLEDLGLRSRILDVPRCISLESSSALINPVIAERAREAGSAFNLRFSPVLTYLANTIRIGERQIPYSLITALEPETFKALKKGSGDESAHPIILNEWAAEDLKAKPGETINVEYYIWREEGQLGQETAQFRLDSVVPLSGPADDRDYAPEYPGITEASNLADWDPPFPINLSLVRPRDEQYWDQHRTTPKAFILLADGERLWRTRYGSLTSVRLFPEAGRDLAQVQDAFTRRLRDSLDPMRTGFSVYSARDQGLTASQGATDFGEYFTYFSFFIVASALLLATLFFRLGIEQRLREIGTLRAVGFPTSSIRNLLLGEAVSLAFIGSLLGAAGAVAYGWLMVFGLRTWWFGAVGTTALKLFISPLSLAIGIAGGVLTAIVCIAWTLRSLAAVSPRSLLTGSLESTRVGTHRRRMAGVFSPVRMGLISAFPGIAILFGAALGFVGKTAGFFGAGTLLLISMISFVSWWLQGDRRALLAGRGWLSLVRLGFRNATYRPGRSVLCIALVSAATFIIVAVDAFRRDPAAASQEAKSGTGGYALVAESLLPIVHDTNSKAGRESLNLSTENDELSGVEFDRFRMRAGDDASCLNLYQPRNPKILAASPEFVRRSRFAFSSSLSRTALEEENPWLLLETLDQAGQDGQGATIPVIADANSLTYALHLKLGEEMTITGDDGSPIRLKVVAALSDSILQAELIMSEQNFVRLFPKEEGFRFFLIDAPPTKIDSVSGVLEERLSDFGFDATSTSARLATFHRVENTYLSTFQTLGGLGLLLGTIGLAAVLVRNVIERRRELALLRAFGYRSSHFALMVLAENLLLLLLGLISGLSCALIAIMPALISRGGGFPVRSLLLLVLVVATGLTASVFAVRTAFKSPLLPALRSE